MMMMMMMMVMMMIDYTLYVTEIQYTINFFSLTVSFMCN